MNNAGNCRRCYCGVFQYLLGRGRSRCNGSRRCDWCCSVALVTMVLVMTVMLVMLGYRRLGRGSLGGCNRRSRGSSRRGDIGGEGGSSEQADYQSGENPGHFRIPFSESNECVG